MNKYNYDNIREATITFYKKHGRAKTLDVFSEYNITNAKELKPEMYESFIDNLRRTGHKNILRLPPLKTNYNKLLLLINN